MNTSWGRLAEEVPRKAQENLYLGMLSSTQEQNHLVDEERRLYDIALLLTTSQKTKSKTMTTTKFLQLFFTWWMSKRTIMILSSILVESLQIVQQHLSGNNCWNLRRSNMSVVYKNLVILDFLPLQSEGNGIFRCSTPVSPEVDW